MNENNLPKIEIKADLTKPIENTYNDGVKKPLKSSSGIISTVLDFFHNTVMYHMQKYNLYAENKLNDYALHLQDEAQKIPDEFLTNPKVNILGPVFDGLKYNLDEEHIKEMFTNILISNMDTRKQSKVLPSYIEIVKQLNNQDAQMLKFFKDNNFIEKPVMKIKYIYNNNGFLYSSNNLVLIIGSSYKILDSIILDNLSRLKLINITTNEYLHDSQLYEKAFEQIKKRSEFTTLPPNVEKIDYKKGLIQITDFGKNFIDICLS